MQTREGQTASVAIGTLLTVVLVLMPQTYAYAPIVGGLAAGALSDHRWEGARAGVVMGTLMIPVGVGLTLVTVYLPSGLETGLGVLFRSMRGMGPRSLVFYGTVVYFLALYTALVAGVFGTLSGYASEAVDTRV